VKSVLKGAPPFKRTYPYIGQSADNVVLFCAPRTGTVLRTALPAHSEIQVGWSQADWREDDFEPMQGSIELSND